MNTTIIDLLNRIEIMYNRKTIIKPIILTTSINKMTLNDILNNINIIKTDANNINHINYYELLKINDKQTADIIYEIMKTTGIDRHIILAYLYNAVKFLDINKIENLLLTANVY